MKSLTISTMAVVMGLAVATAAQAKGPSGKSGNAKSFSPTTSFKTSTPTAKSFHKNNTSFKGKDYFKCFSHRCWLNNYGCYSYWCPTNYCHYYWYEPYACYCPIEYITVAAPVVVVTQPVIETVTTKVITTQVTTPVVKTVTPVVKTIATTAAHTQPTPPPPGP